MTTTARSAVAAHGWREPLVSRAELERRTIRRRDFVSCNEAFIDCRTPGSEQKRNYAMIGPGVSQSDQQFVNLREPHGFNIGAAGMPHGVTNNLHLHFSAEVFLCYRGEFLLRWGVEGDEGEYLLREGDIASIPPWIFRGFTNVGPDDGILFTVLGFDDTGGIVWSPSVLREAATHGLYLTTGNQLVDTVAGDPLPPETERVRPMPEGELARLRRWPADRLRRRISTRQDLGWSGRPFLCSDLPGGGAELATVIGYGVTEDRDQCPRVHSPHNFSIAWLRAGPGQGVLRHRHEESQVLMARDGGWQVWLNEGDDELSVELGPWDMLSVPPGAWRRVENAGDRAAELAVVTGGDGRVRLDWAPEVVRAARGTGWVHDAAGYLAPRAVAAPRAGEGQDPPRTRRPSESPALRDGDRTGHGRRTAGDHNEEG